VIGSPAAMTSYGSDKLSVRTIMDNAIYRNIILPEKKHFTQHYVTIITSSGHEHAQTTAHGHFPIGCPLEPSRYLSSFPRYLAPYLRQKLVRDDVITDVIRPGSTISVRTI